ncbi:hypothetical protein FRX31_011727, partial [Thalictrum thalictroides]
MTDDNDLGNIVGDNDLGNTVGDNDLGEDPFFQSDDDDENYHGNDDDEDYHGNDDDVSLDREFVSDEGVENEVVSDGKERNEAVSDGVATISVITPAWDTEFVKNTARIEEHCEFDNENKVDDDYKLFEGQIWETAQLCREYLREHAIKRKFALILPKNNSDKIIGVCKAENCKWRVYIRRMNDNHSMRLRKLEDAHSCV